MNDYSTIRDSLQLGLSVVTQLWFGEAKNWITCVFAADIDNDGKIEILAGSKDGRVQALSEDGKRKWIRIIGSKAIVNTLTVINHPDSLSSRIVVGTQDGKIYVLCEDGKTIDPRGKTYTFDSVTGFAHDQEEKGAYWQSYDYGIRHVAFNMQPTPIIIAGTDDYWIRAFNYHTQQEAWCFQTNDWIRAVTSSDINDDDELETLVSSGSKHLDILDSAGRCILSQEMPGRIETMHVNDVDGDGKKELLAVINGKKLYAFSFRFKEARLAEIWHSKFENRLRCFYVTDLNKDGTNEILVGSEDNHLYILDKNKKVLWRANLGYRIRCLYALDFNQDGKIELLAGSEDTHVYALRIQLVDDLIEKVQQQYQQFKKPRFTQIVERRTREYALLTEIITGVRQSTRTVRIRDVKNAQEAGDHRKALANALFLEQQKVQLLWSEETQGFIATADLGDISGDPKLEIITTDEDDIYAYSSQGKLLWRRPIGSRIKMVYIGYLLRKRWQQIAALGTDGRLHIYGHSSHTSDKEPTKMLEIPLEANIASFDVKVSRRSSLVEYVLGSLDKQIFVYKQDLKTLQHKIMVDPPRGITDICVYQTRDDTSLSIVAASADKTIDDTTIYGYTRTGRALWTYQIRGTAQVKSLQLHLEDINNDRKVEVVIGSGDRNVHVLDSEGHLIWRYYLPNNAAAVDVARLEHDGPWCILVGCKDNFLYVFNHEGDLLWKYNAGTRISAVRAGDIDNQDDTEIVLGLGDALEALQIIDQTQLQEFIDQSWQALLARHSSSVIDDFLQDDDYLLRIFALRKLAAQPEFSQKDFKKFERAVNDEVVDVRKALVPLIMAKYAVAPQKAFALLNVLASDRDQDVQLEFVQNINVLREHDQELAFEYLNKFFKNMNRFGRRTIIRTLHSIFTTHMRSIGTSNDKGMRQLFQLLLKGACDAETSDKSDWVRQEAARTLASVFDHYRFDLLLYIQRMIVKNVEPDILLQISYNATTPFVQQIFRNLAPLLPRPDDPNSGLNESNIVNLLGTAVQTLRDRQVRSLRYGEETLLIYAELYRLFEIKTVDDIAQYRCCDDLLPDSEKFRASDERGEHFRTVAPLFTFLQPIAHQVGRYLQREDANDRMTALLEARSALEAIGVRARQAYQTIVVDETLERLPDRRLFELLIGRWQTLVDTKLSELRGKADLKVELKTPSLQQEEQVAFLLAVRNAGRSSAQQVEITLLSSGDFTPVGQASFTIDILPGSQEVEKEFCIQPHTSSPYLNFEISYREIDAKVNDAPIFKRSGHKLELSSSQQVFRPIPNLYTMGLPVHDSKMFYGREEDINILKDNLTRAGTKTVVVLFGERRFGKTTLLLHLVNTPVLEQHIPVLIDMQMEALNISLSKFLRKIAHKISKEFQKRNIPLQPPNAAEFEQEPTFAFDAFLDEAEERLQDRTIIIMIDEFEILSAQVAQGKLKSELFWYLRGLMQHRKSINFLLAGTHKIEDLTKDYWSVFFNMAFHHHLSHLSPKGATDLITKPVAGYLEYETYVIQKIRELTGDQPYLIHLICRALVDHCNYQGKAYVTMNDVNIVLNDVLQTAGGDHFSWILSQIAPRDRIVLSALAEKGGDEGRFLSSIDIYETCTAHFVNITHEALLESLEKLSELKVIASKNDDSQVDRAERARYSIPVGLIRIWLRRKKPLEVILREENLNNEDALALPQTQAKKRRRTAQ
jgi:outer membrane protein assembly factor BamB